MRFLLCAAALLLALTTMLLAPTQAGEVSENDGAADGDSDLENAEGLQSVNPLEDAPTLEEILVKPWFAPEDAQKLREARAANKSEDALKILQKIENSEKHSVPAYGFAFIRGTLYYEQGKCEEASAQFEKILGNCGGLRDYAVARLINCLLPKENYEKIELLSRDAPAESVFYADILSARLKALNALKRSKEALDAAAVYAEKGNDAPRMADILLSGMDASAALDDKTRAFGFARRLFRFFPDRFSLSDMSEAAQKSGYSAYWDVFELANDRIDRGDRYSDAGLRDKAAAEYAEAVKLLKDSNKDAAAPDCACKGKARLSREYIKMKKFKEGLAEADEALAYCKKSGGENYEEGLYSLGLALYAEGKKAEAKKKFKEVVKISPKGRFTVASIEYLLDLTADEDDSKEEGSLLRALQEISKKPKQMERIWLRSWALYMNKKTAEALDLWERIAKDEQAPPIDRQRAAYWLARDKQKNKKTAEAEPLYKKAFDLRPMSYYGVIASARLTELDKIKYSDETLFPRKPPMPFASWALPYDSFKGKRYPALKRRNMRAFIELLASGVFAGKEATDELNAVNAVYDDDETDFLTALIYYKYDDRVRAVFVARDAINVKKFGELPDAALPYWLIAFPRLYDAEAAAAVKEWGKNKKLSVETMLTLMREESLFNPVIKSYANALGLTQIINSTGKIIAKRMKMKKYKFADLTDPATSVNMGCWFFNYLMDLFKGKLPLAIASYNAGETRIKKWVKAQGDLPMDEFIEAMSIDQTRNYTKRLLRTYAIYRYIYTDARPVFDVDISSPANK